MTGGDPYDTGYGGSGGPGVDAVDGTAVSRSSVLLGGLGCLGYCGGPSPGGPPTVGAVTEVVEPVRAMTPTQLIVREQSGVGMRLVGEPGDAVRLRVSDGTASTLQGTAEGFDHARPGADVWTSA